jgi:hypothetical protein
MQAQMRQIVREINRFGFLTILLALSLWGCVSDQAEQRQDVVPSQFAARTAPSPAQFDRSQIEKNLRGKVRAGQPLIAHVLVPLCDNEDQGIVKVNASLGDGQNTRTNLYWGAGYGIKTHFKRAEDWKTVLETVPAESHILDRAVFYKKFPSGAKVYLIADAYDGAYMRTCVADFLEALAGRKTGSISIGTEAIPGWSGADLLGFNGHNGLMDVDVATPSQADGRHRDAVVIACASNGYFAEPLEKIDGFPLLTTTNLLAPEAYILRAVLDGWGELKSGAEIRLAAGAAYNNYQKCGLNGATRLFKTGW